MPIVLPCGCRAGGPKDWVCSRCGKCATCCKHGEGDGVHPVHIGSEEGASVLFEAYRQLGRAARDAAIKGSQP